VRLVVVLMEDWWPELVVGGRRRSWRGGSCHRRGDRLVEEAESPSITA